MREISTEVGQVHLSMHVDAGNLYSEIRNTSVNATKQASSLFSGLGKAAIAAFSVSTVTKFTKSCLEIGSNLAEVQNVVDTAFKTMSSEADSFAKSAMTNFGMSELSAKKYLGVFGQMSSAMGMSEKAALDMAKSVTALTGDIASYNNLNLDEAYTKLKSIWTGETESLKDLGVIMSQTNLDQYALNNGFGKTTAKMTEQEKLMLRYQYVTSALSNASGDFIKTQGSWANQTRVLSLRYEQLKATLGQSFIALFTPIVKGLNSCMEGLQDLADTFKDFITAITGTEAPSGALSTSMSELSSEALEAAANIAGIGDATEQAAKTAEKSLAGFDKITKIGSSGTQTTGTSVKGSSKSSNGSKTDNSEKKVSAAQQLLEKFKAWSDSSFSDIFSHFGENFSSNTKKLRENIKKFSQDVKQLSAPLKDYFKNEFTTALQEGFKAADIILNGAYDTFNQVCLDIWDKAAYPMLSSFVSKGLPMFTEFTGRMAGLSGELYTEFDANFKRIWGDAVSPYIETLSVEWTDCMDVLHDAWNKWGESTFASITSAAHTTGSVFDGIWNNTLKPIIESAIERVSGIWGEHLKPLMSNLTDFAGEWVNCATTIYNNFIAPVISALDKVLGPVVSRVFNNIGNIVGFMLSVIADTVNNIITVFKGLIQFMTGIFSGDWKKAWSGVENIFVGAWNRIKSAFSKGGEIFSTIKDGILSSLRSVINFLLSGINSVIEKPFRGLNDALASIRKVNILGLKPFSGIPQIAVPKIPMLAQGAYVKPNTPQLAMIGDNRHQGEFVAPEDKLAQMAIEAARISGNSSMSLLAEAVRILKEILKVLKELDPDIQIDGESVKKIIVDSINENTRATGKCEIAT